MIYYSMANLFSTNKVLDKLLIEGDDEESDDEIYFDGSDEEFGLTEVEIDENENYSDEGDENSDGETYNMSGGNDIQRSSDNELEEPIICSREEADNMSDERCDQLLDEAQSDYEEYENVTCDIEDDKKKKNENMQYALL
jgi:hypothetical protein